MSVAPLLWLFGTALAQKPPPTEEWEQQMMWDQMFYAFALGGLGLVVIIVLKILAARAERRED